MPILTLADIDALTRASLAGSGAVGIQLDQATSAVVEAEADGIRTVGLGYLPVYCEHLRCGKVVGTAIPGHEKVAASTIASDAKQGFSFAAFHEAMNDFHNLAHAQGVAALAIRNSTSAGVLGWFVERTANAGLIGLCFANSSALMAPYGGKRRFFGTNPLAYGVPRGAGKPPLIADMATSQVAYVTVKDHAERGKDIPLGWAVDRHGNPTTNPNDMLDGGAMAPAGGYKGALLALLVDVLAGGLAGPNFAFQASSFGDTEGGPPDVGQFLLAISPQAFGGTAGFADRLEVMLDALAQDDGVRMPGDGRYAHRKAAQANGIEVPEELIDKLQAYA
jgi:(2R)-3-sulfolactate dehydrogenase (NADP+)